MQAVDYLKSIGNYSYSTRHCIGQGSYGKVFEGTDLNKAQVAIKQMDLRFLEADKYLKSQLKVEIEVLKRLKHANIVRLIDVLQSANSMYIVTEFCKDGDLKEALNKRKMFAEGDALNIFFQILDGFQQLVNNGVIHRDLKPANILIHAGIYKIADFGFARFVTDFNYSLLKSCVGSPLYMAPQLLLRKPYTTKCDVWSLGIIFFEMLFGETPWKGIDEKDLLNNILKKLLVLPRKVSKFVEDVLRRMLVIEEKDRISWDELFELKAKRLKKDMEILDRENKPPQIAAGGLKGEKKRLPDNVTAEQNDREFMVAEQKKYLKAINILREELCFKHYVGVRLLASGMDLTKSLKLKGQLLEKFQMLCAQAVRHACRILVQDLGEKVKKDIWASNKELRRVQGVLEKEGKFYQELYEDLIKQYKAMNVFESLKADKEVEALFEGDLCEKNKEIVGGCIRKTGFEVLKAMVPGELGNEVSEKDRETLISLEYLMDFMACLIRQGNKPEVDYENLHREKSEGGEIKAYWERLCAKRNAILGRKDF